MKKYAAIAVLVLGSVACGGGDKPADPAQTTSEPAVSATTETSATIDPSAATTTTETSATTVTETTDTTGTPQQ